jgi:Protein of unknown function (DUF3592)
MSEPQTFEWILLVVLLAGMGWWYSVQIRHYLKRQSSRRWPTANATIRKGAVVRVSGNRGSWAYGSFLKYAFEVQDEGYAGLFALIGDEEHAVALQDRLADASLTVRYNPRDPNISFVADPYDSRFEGLTATQNPIWLDQAPPFQITNAIRR